ncbi:hypothetical protein HHK02_06130 [Limosilactobacillus reuteri]|uniref:Uncharacterized protein n=1 Tax=Limosilactobacillus reuteri TaxID=1598 RepID=A0A7L6BF92_LIMRT|nr:hypothetical protein [Limosilactobacillus reuteri]QLQ60808.1 hypothetical protein HHK02_06130 [Limosilactobacillus reuteri]
MTKNATGIYEYLDDEKINYQIIMHPPVYTAEQADKYVQEYQFKNINLPVRKTFF